MVCSYSILTDSFVIPSFHEFHTPAWLDHSPNPKYTCHLLSMLLFMLPFSLSKLYLTCWNLTYILSPSNIFKNPALIPHPGIFSLSSEGLQLYRNYSGGVLYYYLQFKELLNCKLLQDGDELFHLLILRMPCSMSLWTCCCLITIHWVN